MATELSEQSLYMKLVPSALDRRLQSMVTDIRAAVARAVVSYPFSEVFVDPPEVARTIEKTHFRIAGAPYTNWAGTTDPLHFEEMPRTLTTQGVIATLLKHRAAGSRDTFRLALDANGATQPCDMTPLFDSAEPNAYYLPKHNCVVIQLGLLQSPFADESFDDASLLGRLGFIIAHEFAHASHHVFRYEDTYSELLDAYAFESTREEALADTVALFALGLTPGAPSCDDLLLHIGQLFCAIPYDAHALETVFPATRLSHPPGNTRVDDLFETARYVCVHRGLGRS